MTFTGNQFEFDGSKMAVNGYRFETGGQGKWRNDRFFNDG